MSFRRSHRQPGFTLIEILIATTVFLLATLIATAVYVASSNVQRREQSLARLQDDARFLIETVAQAVRTDGVDYSSYLASDGDPLTPPSINLQQPQATVVTRDDRGLRTFYRFNPTTGKIGACTEQVGVDPPTRCNAGSSAYSDVTPPLVTVNDFKVWVRPFADPYALPPRQATDCATERLSARGGVPPQSGYDASLGVCTCAPGTYGSEPTRLNGCFVGQRCQQSGTDALGPIYTCAPPNEQVRLTLMLRSTGGENPNEQRTSTLQTTVTARLYRR